MVGATNREASLSYELDRFARNDGGSACDEPSRLNRGGAFEFVRDDCRCGRRRRWGWCRWIGAERPELRQKPIRCTIYGDVLIRLAARLVPRQNDRRAPGRARRWDGLACRAVCLQDSLHFVGLAGSATDGPGRWDRC